MQIAQNVRLTILDLYSSGRSILPKRIGNRSDAC